MPIIKIASIPIDFPYQPYPAQIVTMSKIIASLKSSASGLIESPTGTGKTLAILCAVLGYNAHTNNKVRVYISTRTHKQIDQFIEQLRRTTYTPVISILASRMLTCIHPVARSNTDLEKTCSDLLKRNGCSFFQGKEKLLAIMEKKISDIEELKKEGKKCGGCPFYASRIAQAKAEIVFCPYNYIIDENIRKAMDIDLRDAVVIVDEAHNIEDFCRSAGSVEVDSRVIDIVGMEIVKRLRMGFMDDALKKDLYCLLEMLNRLKKIGDKGNKRDNRKTDSFNDKNDTFKENNGKRFSVKTSGGEENIFKGDDILKMLESHQILKQDILNFKNTLVKLSGNEDTRDMLAMSSQQILESLCFVLETLHFKNPNFYSFSLKRDMANFSLCFWLLDPSLIFLSLANIAKSVVLLSGTLSPFKTFTSELGFNFSYLIEAPHVIDSKNVFISSIETGHLGKEIIGTYGNIENFVYLDQVIRIIQDIRSKVQLKGGTLVFVSSYSFLENLKKRMGDVKYLHIEPKNTTAFTEMFKAFKLDILKNKGPILMCVYRGRASEGMDFKDNYCRAVIAIGLPFPALSDEVKAKKEYNDKYKGLKGNQWYEAQAFRAVNQAVGRVIRHKDDWGGVFLVDKRYSQVRVHENLPRWVKANLKKHESSKKCLEMWEAFVSNK